MASKLKNQLHTFPPGASETGCAYPYCPDPVTNNIVLDDLNAVIAQTNLTNEIQQLVAVGLPTQSALTAEYYHIVCDEEYVDPGQLSGMVADFCLCYEDPERAASNRIDCEILSDVYWYHPDYVGSNELITDITGEPYQYFFYTPFGETILQEDAFTASYDNPWRFNGKELDPETGNYYYGARYYNPKWSVWLSVDAMAGNAHNLPLTPYHFLANNPVMIVDPDGNDWFVNTETGETSFRPNFGKDDAGELGESFLWIAGNNDLELDINDWLEGEMIVGNGDGFEYIGHDFNASTSENIMNKNEYEMRPLEAATTTSYSIQHVTSPKIDKWTPKQITNEYITEEWKRVTYVPRELHQMIKQSLVTGTDLSPMGQMSTIYRDVSYEYKQIGFLTRMITGLNSLGEGLNNLFTNHHVHKRIVKP